MTYAKQVINDEVVALLTYDFTPDFGDDATMFVITEEEYNKLYEEFIASRPQPDPNVISDRKALEIITGGGV